MPVPTGVGAENLVSAGRPPSLCRPQHQAHETLPGASGVSTPKRIFRPSANMRLSKSPSNQPRWTKHPVRLRQSKFRMKVSHHPHARKYGIESCIREFYPVATSNEDFGETTAAASAHVELRDVDPHEPCVPMPFSQFGHQMPFSTADLQKRLTFQMPQIKGICKLAHPLGLPLGAVGRIDAAIPAARLLCLQLQNSLQVWLSRSLSCHAALHRHAHSCSFAASVVVAPARYTHHHAKVPHPDQDVSPSIRRQLFAIRARVNDEGKQECAVRDIYARTPRKEFIPDRPISHNSRNFGNRNSQERPI